MKRIFERSRFIPRFSEEIASFIELAHFFTECNAVIFLAHSHCCCRPHANRQMAMFTAVTPSRLILGIIEIKPLVISRQQFAGIFNLVEVCRLSATLRIDKRQGILEERLCAFFVKPDSVNSDTPQNANGILEKGAAFKIGIVAKPRRTNPAAFWSHPVRHHAHAIARTFRNNFIGLIYDCIPTVSIRIKLGKNFVPSRREIARIHKTIATPASARSQNSITCNLLGTPHAIKNFLCMRLIVGAKLCRSVRLPLARRHELVGKNQSQCNIFFRIGSCPRTRNFSFGIHLPVVIAAAPHRRIRFLPDFIKRSLIIGIKRDKHAIADTFAHGIARSFAFGTVNKPGTCTIRLDISTDQPLPGTIESLVPIGFIDLWLCIRQIKDCK